MFGVAYSVLSLSMGTPEKNTEANSDLEDWDQLSAVIDTRGDGAQLRTVLESGASANAVDNTGEPVLSLVIADRDNKANAYGMVRALLDYGANPNQVGEGGWTPVHWACHGGGRSHHDSLAGIWW